MSQETRGRRKIELDRRQDAPRPNLEDGQRDIRRLLIIGASAVVNLGR
jgi:hypothetical protein